MNAKVFFLIAALCFVAASTEECGCGLSYIPVCDTLGTTHVNLCALNCAGATYATDGACSESGNSLK